MVHELSYAECPKSYVFRGSKDYQPKQIIDMLGLNPSNRMAQPRPGQPMPAPAASKFLLPVQACEFQLTNILEGLQRDPWPVEQDKRPLRCTGVAMGVATALLEVSCHNLVIRAKLMSSLHSPTLELESCCSLVDLLPTDLDWSLAQSLGSQSDPTTILTEIASSTSSVPPRYVHLHRYLISC
jgi:hypothetical protein